MEITLFNQTSIETLETVLGALLPGFQIKPDTANEDMFSIILTEPIPARVSSFFDADKFKSQAVSYLDSMKNRIAPSILRAGFNITSSFNTFEFSKVLLTINITKSKD